MANALDIHNSLAEKGTPTVRHAKAIYCSIWWAETVLSREVANVTDMVVVVVPVSLAARNGPGLTGTKVSQ